VSRDEKAPGRQNACGERKIKASSAGSKDEPKGRSSGRGGEVQLELKIISSTERDAGNERKKRWKICRSSTDEAKTAKMGGKTTRWGAL